jgi:hypothetical protein
MTAGSPDIKSSLTHVDKLSLLLLSATIFPAVAQPRDQLTLVCDSVATTTKSTNGETTTERAEGVLSLLIDFRSQSVVNSSGLRFPASITDSLITYDTELTLGPGKMAVSGRLDRITGTYHQEATYDQASIKTTIKLRASCRAKERSF